MSDESIFNSNRHFIVHSYSASHGLLLLRSRKTMETPTRLDVLFQDVRAVEIRMWFTGLEIDEVDANLLSGYPSRPVDLLEPGNKVYALRGHGWEGFLVAGIVSYKEDDEEQSAPSGLTAARNSADSPLT